MILRDRCGRRSAAGREAVASRARVPERRIYLRGTEAAGQLDRRTAYGVLVCYDKRCVRFAGALVGFSDLIFPYGDNAKDRPFVLAKASPKMVARLYGCWALEVRP